MCCLYYCPRRTRAHRLEPLRNLLISAAKVPAEAIAELTAFELRDALLVLDPLSKPWVQKVNQAEAEFWKRCVHWGDTCIWLCMTIRLPQVPGADILKMSGATVEVPVVSLLVGMACTVHSVSVH
jgi:hypothetical protein